MKIQNIVKLLGVGVMALMMAGCSNEFDEWKSDREEPISVPGGTASAPAEMSLDLQNVIVKNAYYNYFDYEAKEGEKLDIQATLEMAILSSERAECQQSGDTYIAVYDAGMTQLEGFRTCSTGLKVEFPVDGRYIFQIKYPGNEGYFYADSTRQ